MLERIEVKNFKGILYLNEKLEKTTDIYLPNHKGKTSLGEAIFFALTGLNTMGKKKSAKKYLSKRFPAADFSIIIQDEDTIVTADLKHYSSDYDTNLLCKTYCFEQIDSLTATQRSSMLKEHFFSKLSTIDYKGQIAVSKIKEGAIKELFAKEVDDSVAMEPLIRAKDELLEKLRKSSDVKCQHCGKVATAEFSKAEVLQGLKVIDEEISTASGTISSAVKGNLSAMLQKQMMVTVNLENEKAKAEAKDAELIKATLDSLDLKQCELVLKSGKVVIEKGGVDYADCSRSEKMLAVREIQFKMGGTLHWDDNAEAVESFPEYDWQNIRTHVHGVYR